MIKKYEEFMFSWAARHGPIVGTIICLFFLVSIATPIIAGVAWLVYLIMKFGIAAMGSIGIAMIALSISYKIYTFAVAENNNGKEL